jgi:hypothetical protein
VDPYLSKGHFPIRTPQTLEDDIAWWDPKVPDGTSLAGAMGQGFEIIF